MRIRKAQAHKGGINGQQARTEESALTSFEDSSSKWDVVV